MESKKKRTGKKKKHPGGRPRKFDKETGIVKAEITPEAIGKLYSKGFIDDEICEILNITHPSLNAYKKQNEKFFTSIKKGKAISDEKVEAALFERATGYEHEDLYITQYQGEIIKEQIIKKYPPDPTSMIFWLKNRKPAEWRDKQEVEVNVKKLLMDL